MYNSTNMAALKSFLQKFNKTLILTAPYRNIHLTATQQLKEIITKKDGENLIIEGAIVPEKKEHLLVKTVEGACSLCSTGLDLKHTDVLILSQFLRSDGCMLPRRITGLCKIQQRRVTKMVAMAQKAGLMPNLAPAWSKRDPTLRFRWKKFNTYFDESTIRQKYL